MRHWEERLWKWMRRNILWICCAAVVLLGFLIRYWYLPQETHDLNHYYALWIEQFERFGLSAAFVPKNEFDYSMAFAGIFILYAKVFGSVNVPLLIKLTNCLLEMVTVGLCLAMLLSLLPKERRPAALLTGLTVLWLNPIMIWNAIAWGQTDVYYLMISVLTVFLLIRNKPVWALLCLSIGIALKLQTIFLLPLFVMAWFCGPKKFSCLWFLMIPAAIVVTGLPALLIGESPLATVDAYLFQGGDFKGLAVNKHNLYTVIGSAAAYVSEETLGMFSRTSMVLCMAALGGMAVWLIARRAVWTGRGTLLLAAWCVLCCNFLLPRMHERYAIVGEILLCCWAVCLWKPRGFLYILCMLLPTLSTYSHLLYASTFLNGQVGGVINLCLFCAVTWETLREMRGPGAEAVPS